ncbi:hypothetical protein [Deinococcus kurensis]|uniref:hypothetical protein n=1 Tax=Deinococcus kurensis TaxID=2662757 RepID=UPI0012D36854|nr:hypothetical protein [Deinococcus kurensis]
MRGFDDRLPRAKTSIVLHAGYASWGARHSRAIEAMVRMGYALTIQRQTRYGVVDEFILTHRGRVARDMLGVTGLDWEAATLTADQAPVFLLR